jgi:hypothetical protein
MNYRIAGAGTVCYAYFVARPKGDERLAVAIQLHEVKNK